MKETIKKVLDRHKDSQGNMSSDVFRQMLATEIEAVLLSTGLPDRHLHSNHLAEGPDENGLYPWHKQRDEAWVVQEYNRNRPVEEHVKSVEEIKTTSDWICNICGEDTSNVEYDYLGSGTNHLGCDLKVEIGSDEEG